ncbi:MAG: asparagine synthase (glutamine-hydrolyzing) [Dehalococcoidia bacterium]
MCGIVGIVHRDPRRPVDRSILCRMLDAIEHRGPDDEGIFLQDNVGLGMRRLSIIDLAGGHQPLFNETGDRVIVFNGEIYNYRAIRAHLDARGHRFTTASDTETVVHLHEDLGADCVERLRGMFAFAIWNSADRELLLARDRFGIKPLYVLTAPWGLAFASEMKAIHASGLMATDLDWEALDGLFRVGYVAAPRSPFREVQKLEPGHVLTWKIGRQPTTRRYWDVPNGLARWRPDAEEAVRARLDESVRAHLVADVPVAAFLSGGLDSSAVVSSMAIAGEDVHAFTVRYQGSGARSVDETPLAQALADRYGIRLTVVDVEPNIEKIFEPIVTAMDEPHGDESAIPTWLLCERVARDYKVALVGTGGDELFAGYPRHLGLAAAGLWGKVPKPFRNAINGLVRRLPEARGGGLRVTRLKRFTRASGDSLASRYFSLQNRLDSERLFTREVREQVLTGYTLQTFERHGTTAPTDGSVRPALYIDYRTYLPEDLLHLADRISMAHSLELRVPFVDHEVVEDLFPLPDRIRVGRGRPKALLRRAMEPRLTPGHFAAPKQGFVGPTALWLRNELATMLADELSSDRIRRLGFFDPAVVEHLRREHAEGRQNHEGVLWALLCFLTWHRVYVEPGRGCLGKLTSKGSPGR